MPILQWLTRKDDVEAASHVPYRVLEEVPELSYGSPDTENMLIQGDNLDALKALLPYYAGQVKCIYIDPPYNTGHAFEQYDDNVEHSQWLALMYPRLALLRDFLSEEGSIWISMDDDESHYLKVICDEIFGRNNFVANVIWQKRTSPDMRAAFSDGHENVLLYAKNKELFKTARNKVIRLPEQAKEYKNPDNDPRGPWVSSDYTAQGFRPNQMYEITTPSGKVFTPPPGVCWKNVKEVFDALVKDNRMWFGKKGDSMPRRKTFLRESEGLTPWTWWPNKEVGHTQEAKKESNALFGEDNSFATPKPERLIERIIHIASNPGDLVMDSFLGSGTTAAVAHKMGRRYIGIEMGEHCETHCRPRLAKVVDGEQGGISKPVNWQGGGGFRYYKLGETIFMEDGEINPAVTFPTLAAHIWFTETYTPLPKREVKTTFLGIHDKTAYALLYNGILKDRSIAGGNVLTRKTLSTILDDIGAGEYDKIVVYGESCRLGASTLKAHKVLFKQTPYDLKA